MTIEEIRKQYPEYDDLSDTQLADALYRKDYSDMDKAEFYYKMGLDMGNIIPVNKDQAIDRLKFGVDVFKDARSNIPKSAYNVAEQTVKGAIGGLQTVDSIMPGGIVRNIVAGHPERSTNIVKGLIETSPIDVLKGIGGYYSDRFLGKDEKGRNQFIETFREDPVGTALDLSVIGSLRNIARQGLLARRGRKITPELIKEKTEESIGFPSSKTPDVREASTQAVLEEGIDLLNSNSANIIDDKITDLSNKLTKKIEEAESMFGGKSKTGKDIALYTRNSPSKDGFFFEDGKIYVDSRVIAEDALSPLLKDLNDPKSDGRKKRNQVKKEMEDFSKEVREYGNGRYLTLQQLQDYKKSLYADLGDAAYKNKTSTQKEAKKLLANASKRAIEQAVPEAADLNRRMSNLLTLKNQGKAVPLINKLIASKPSSATKLFHSMLTRSAFGAMLGGLLNAPKTGAGIGMGAAILNPELSNAEKFARAMEMVELRKQAINRDRMGVTVPAIQSSYYTGGLLESEE